MTREEYIENEVRKARQNVINGYDAHGREIMYASAYVNKTRSNAQERWDSGLVDEFGDLK